MKIETKAKNEFMPSQNITFKNNKGIELAAKLETPESGAKSYAIFAHCFTCNKNLSAVRNISKALNQYNIAVLRFDFTGLGESEGEFKSTNFSSNVEDLIAAANFLEEHYDAPKLIIGHSLGGAAVIFAAGKIPSIQAVSTIGAPSSAKHVAHLFESDIDAIQLNGVSKVNIGGRPFEIEKHFLEDIKNKDTEAILSSSNKAILVLHSPQDTVVGIKNASKIYKAAKHPKSFISLNGANHLLTKREDSIYVGTVIAVWADRYLK